MTQLERYKNTISYIQQNFKEKIDIDLIESISNYSYRNINRIFLALHHETIGKYIKRIRLEKAAEYLKFSNHQISDIALEVGFSDAAAFSKAFKKKFNCSPLGFRQSAQQLENINRQGLSLETKRSILQFDIEELPEFRMLFLEHRGDYENIVAIEKSWNTFLQYCDQENLLTNDTIFLSETLDDNEISEQIHCRTNIAIILDDKIQFIPEGLFQIKKHQAQRYAKFIHFGKPETLKNSYDLIYAAWITDVQLEFADKPILEFYVNHDKPIPPEQFITEIYIPVE